MALVVKNPPANAEDIRDTSSVPESERPLGGGQGTHSNILAWRIPWTEQWSYGHKELNATEVT